MEASASETLDPLAVIETAPADEWAILELRLDWPPDLEIYPEQRQLWLRFLVLTKDPFTWIANRGDAWATATADEKVLEVDIYVTLDALRRAIEEHGGDLAAAVGHWASPVMQSALEHEAELIDPDYHDRALAGTAPRLLDDLDRDLGAFARPPEIQVRQSWSAIGLGALHDLVQDSFGKVLLDRSDVELDLVEPPTEDCPACKGFRFRFPGELESARETMCPTHSAMAQAANQERLRDAHESNRAGWRAIDKAAMRVNKAPEPYFHPQPPRVVAATPARNEPCPCGSGKKYKRCHGA